MFIKKTICDVIHSSSVELDELETRKMAKETLMNQPGGETILKRSVSCNKDDNWQMGIYFWHLEGFVRWRCFNIAGNSRKILQQ
jgi:hypothetical protein